MRFLSVLLFFVACGKDSSSKPEPGTAGVATRKPCEYMARADAEAAIELKLPNTNEGMPPGECDYTTAEFYGAALGLGPWESVKMAASAGHSKPIAGVGDEALWIGRGHLYVRKGDAGFMIAINGPAVDALPDEGLAKAKTLALTILAKM